jgi:hypothetical protein
MTEPISPFIMEKIRHELEELDAELIQVDGKQLKPSQCYRFETDPVHVMFNTNCPDQLRAKVEEILAKYTVDEGRS